MIRARTSVSSLLALLCLLAGTSSAQAPTVLVPRGATWRYLDDGSDQGSAWRAPAFYDGTWRAGRAQLGYGDGDETTTVDSGSFFARNITTYFRHTFQVAERDDFARLRLRLLRDDGAVVYLNGTEVTRSNILPFINVDEDTPASSNIDGSDENVLVESVVPASLLRAGANVLAVEVHQSSPFSSDVSFDVELSAELIAARRLRGPYLQQGTSTEITVRWRTDAATVGRVWYGSAPNQLLAAATEPAAATNHSVTLTGLTPSTTYHYAVGFGSQRLAGGDADHHFVTAPPPGSRVPTRVWVLGDSGTADARPASVRDAYLAFTGSRRTDLWLMLGDNAYTSGTDAQYQAAVFDMFPGMLRQSVLWPTRGNHEDIASDYYGMFTLPKSGEAGGMPSGTEAYYSFDHANVHFICLDSFATYPFPDGAMWRWLESDLAATQQDWIVAFWHHPPYSKGTHDSDTSFDLIKMRTYFLPLLEDGGVDLVLSGHSHNYERSYLIDGHYGFSFSFDDSNVKDGGDGRVGGDGAYQKAPMPHAGTVYVVAGSSGSAGGGSLDHPAMFYSVGRLGSLVLDVDGDRMDVRFLNSTGTVEDQFTMRKYLDRGLTADRTTLSVVSGGSQRFTLDAGPAYARKWSYLVGSMTGTEPGHPLDSLIVPLVPDSYTQQTIASTNTAFFQNNLARLDAAGRSTATLTLPPGLSTGMIGLTLFHAYVVFDVPGTGKALFASNPFPLTFVR